MTARRAEPVTAATRVARWGALATAIILLLGDATPARAAVRVHPRGATRPSVSRAAPGPWGTLELTRIELDPPRDAVSRSLPTEAPRWSFPSADHAGVLAALRKATLTPTQIERCESHGRWTSSGSATVVEPPPDVIFGLLPEARARLYSALAGSEANADQRNPMPVSQAVLAAVQAAHLTPQTLRRFHEVLYGPGPWRLLSDIPALLAGCASPAERIRLMTAILRHESYVLRLVVTPQSNVDALMAYWSARGRDESGRPLLEAIARLPGETTIEVRGLLPPWHSGHINRYPHPAVPNEPVVDCFWTALNFFDDQPRPAVHSAATVVAALKSRFRPIATPSYGDLVVLLNAAGAPVHAAVFIADNLVLTKNGGSVLRPWVYMKLPDVLDLYSSTHGRLRTVYVTESRAAPARP